MKEISLPKAFEIHIQNPDGTPKLDDNKRPIVQKFTALTFAQNMMAAMPEFTNTGHKGLSAWVRVENSIIEAIEKGAESFRLHDFDCDPICEAVEKAEKYHAQEVIGPRNMLRFVTPWLEAKDAKDE